LNAVESSGILMGIMNIKMNDDNIVSVAQLREFVKLSKCAKFSSSSTIEETYEWIEKALVKFRYSRLKKKKERGVVITYISQMTGLSRSHVKKLIKRKKDKRRLLRITGTCNQFAKIYDAEDIARLIETDNAHERMSGKATKTILRRQYEVYGDLRFEKIQKISVSHIYNLRGTKQYESHILFIEKTKAVNANIGIRKKPQPMGKPGYLRVDSVHQGDLDKQKGVYHINLVDEVTQWEIIGCVEGISEEFLKPLLEELLELFPFVIINFHSDNGSEYINHIVASLLNKLNIDQTKSRSRRTNDNALVESKNGSIIRKYMGCVHIPKKNSILINTFYRKHMDEYLNYHRPCGFSTDKMDERGKIVKKYDVYMTPFEKLKSIPNFEQYLKPGVTLKNLEEISGKESDNSCAENLQKAKKKLLETIKKC
jgi:hypothetical protein